MERGVADVALRSVGQMHVSDAVKRRPEEVDKITGAHEFVLTRLEVLEPLVPPEIRGAEGVQGVRLWENAVASRREKTENRGGNDRCSLPAL